MVLGRTLDTHGHTHTCVSMLICMWSISFKMHTYGHSLVHTCTVINVFPEDFCCAAWQHLLIIASPLCSAVSLLSEIRV